MQIRQLHWPEVCGHRQVICKPNTVKPRTKFEAELYALTKEEGGRHKPFVSQYRPQFFFRTADVTGECCGAMARNKFHYAADGFNCGTLKFFVTEIWTSRISNSVLGDVPHIAFQA